MQRLNSKPGPHFSFLSIALTLVFLAGLGLVVVFNGGSAFSPGHLSAVEHVDSNAGGFSSHAAFEQRCSLCHQPFSQPQGRLCLDCHSGIQEKVDQQVGLHGRLADPLACASCHSEHHGAQYDLIQTALLTFDHQRSGFLLDGAHSQVDCEQCHQLQRYDQADSACISCHAEPQVHLGLMAKNCQECHNTSDWAQASYQGAGFDHEQTGFSLAHHQVDQNQAPLYCTACHADSLQAQTSAQCIQCHASIDAPFMQAHLDLYGDACRECHNGVDRMHAFDHQRVFALDGRHADLPCQSCHMPGNFTAVEPQCASCHEEPDLHRGDFGLNCNYCHSSEAWQPALFKEHLFPLDHGSSQESSCQTCHSESYAQYTCYGCHEHTPEETMREHQEEGIPSERLADCLSCHLNGKVEPEDD